MMEVLYCFTSACLPKYTTMKTQKVGSCSGSMHAKQGGCRVRQQWELWLRFWVVGPHWSSCQKIKWCNVRCLTATSENKKFQHGTFLLSTLPAPLAELSKGFQTRCFGFAQMKASVELCIDKLSDAAAKSELKANCDKFDNEFGELRTPDGLADSCVWSRWIW